MKQAHLAVALLLLAYPLAAAQAPTPDLTPQDLRLQGVPAWQGNVPNTVRAEVTIRNLGNAPSSYSLSWEWVKGSQVAPLAGTRQASTDAGALPPGGNQLHGLDWTPGPGQEGGGAIRVTVTSTSDPNSGNDAVSLPVRVERHALAATWRPESLVLRPDETRYARLHIVNGGTVNETLVLQESAGLPAAFRATLQPGVVTIAPGSFQDVLYYVTLPFAATLPPPADVRLVLASTGTTLTTPPLRLEAAASALPLGALQTNLTGPAETLVRTGQPVVIPIRLANTGAEPNSYAVVVKEPEGWLLQAVPARIALEPGASAEIRLQGHTWAPAVPGTRYDLAVTARSDRGVAGDTQLNMAAFLDGPRMAVAQVSVGESLYRGQPLQVRVVLENRGTQASPAGWLTLATEPFLPETPLSLPTPPLSPGQALTLETNLTASRMPLLLRPAGFAWIDANEDGLVTTYSTGPLDRDGNGQPDFNVNETLYVAQQPDDDSSGFTHPVGGGNVSTGDIRLRGGVVVDGRLAEVGSRVGADPRVALDLDRGPLTTLTHAALACVAPTEAVCGGDAGIVLDIDFDRLLGANDIWLTPDAWPQQLGTPLVGPIANVGSQTYADLDGNGAYSPADSLYLPGFAAGAGDLLRLTDAGFPGGQFVAAGDPDAQRPRRPSPHTALCWDDANGDDQVNPGEGLFLQVLRCGKRSVRSGDVRLASSPGLPAPAPVWPSDPDLARDTVPLPAGTAFFLRDLNNDTQRSVEDAWVLHPGNLGANFGPGDTVLSGTQAGITLPWSLLANGGWPVDPDDSRIGQPLSRRGLQNATLGFSDGDGDGTLGLATRKVGATTHRLDLAFLDLDGDGTSSPGDLRLQCLPVVRSYGGAAACGPRTTAWGSRIGPADGDAGLALQPLGTRTVDGVLGPIGVNATWVAQGPALPAWGNGTAVVRNPGLRVVAPASQSSLAGSTVDFSVPPAAFVVHNNGTHREEIQLHVHAVQGNASLLLPERIWLNPGQAFTVPIRLVLPFPAEAGPTPVTLQAQLVHHAETRAQGQFDVVVKDLLDPEVTVAVPAVWDGLRAVPVTIQASDDTGIDQVWVQAAGDGAPVRTRAVAQGAGRFHAELALGPGAYLIQAEAVDGANRSATSPAVALEVRAVPAPALRILSPVAGSIVGTSQVQVAIVDDFGPHSVRVLLDDKEVTPVGIVDGLVTAPLPVLDPGPHTLRVSVENAAGRRTELTVQIEGPAPDTVPAPAEKAPAASFALLLACLLGALVLRGQRRTK